MKTILSEDGVDVDGRGEDGRIVTKDSLCKDIGGRSPIFGDTEGLRGRRMSWVSGSSGGGRVARE
jgi:hypothetical protein